MKLTTGLFFGEWLLILSSQLFGSQSKATSEVGVRDYDMVVNFDSVNKMIMEEGLDVWMKSGINTQDMKVHVFGIVGLYDKGKTWFINNFFLKRKDKNAPLMRSGMEITTKGLSLIYLEQEKPPWMVIDSAGIQSPVDNRKPKKLGDYKDLAQELFSSPVFTGEERLDELCEDLDKKVMIGQENYRDTEVFMEMTCKRTRHQIESAYLQDLMVDQYQTETMYAALVVQLSDILVFLNNEYTWFEQRRVQDYHYDFMSKSNNKGKTVVVVHNLKDVDTYEKAKFIMLGRLKNAVAGGVPQLESGTKLSFNENYEDKMGRKTIRHFGLCKEQSDCGREVNPNSFDNMGNFFEQLVVHAHTRTESIYEKIANTLTLQEVLHKFVRLVKHDGLTRSARSRTTMPTEADKQSDIICEFDIKASKIKITPPDKYSLAARSAGQLNDFGELVIEDLKFRIPEQPKATPSLRECPPPKSEQKQGICQKEYSDAKYLVFEVPGVNRSSVILGDDVLEDEDGKYRLQVTREKIFKDEGDYKAHDGSVKWVHGQDTITIDATKLQKDGYKFNMDRLMKTVKVGDGILVVTAEK
jgi:hypothetical protein